MVFPTFFNLSLNLAIKSSWSEPQSVPGLVFADCIELLHQSDFSVDWWFPCVESSLVLLERVFAMTSAFSWQNSISLCPASFCTPRPNLPLLQVSLDFLLLHSSPLQWKGHLFWVLVDEHEFERALGVSDAHGSLACHSLRSQGVRHDWMIELNWTAMN